ncbi:MAG: hypothetical protein EBU84_20600, partial [Actinobacteria bacterium]|nr:hypothetical protein [Actinomycetota bacterium]
GGSGYIGGVSNGTLLSGDQTMPNPLGGTMSGNNSSGVIVISYPNSGLEYSTYACSSGSAPARPCSASASTTGTATEIFANWGSGAVLNSGRVDAVEVKYTGYIMSTSTVNATFQVGGDDGQYFTFNGSDIITDCWYDKGSGNCVSTTVTLQANTYYPFTYWFYENGGGANTYLWWNIGGGYVQVPAANFFRSAPAGQSYTVTYDYNSATGGNGTASATYSTGGTAITLPTPTRTGYTFAGWYSDSGLTTSIGGAGASYSPTGTTTSLNAYAKWTANTYTVTYNYNSATGGNGTASANFTTGGTAITLPTPTRTGYTFAGWYSDSGLTTSIGGAGASYSPTGATTSLTAYAKWTGNSNSVSFDPQGGTSSNAVSWTTGTSLTLPATPTRAGYTFNGWYDSATGGTRVGSA